MSALYRCPERPLDPPEPKSPRGRRTLQTQTIYLDREHPLCGESEGSAEYEVTCEMDEGSVYSARIDSRTDEAGRCVAVVPPVDVDLTASERESAEVSYSEACRDDEDAAREDDAGARADR